MSEASGEKQFEPTASRLRRARESGDVPHSSDLSGAIAFAAAIIALCAVMPQSATLAQMALIHAALKHRYDGAVLSLLLLCAIGLPLSASICGSIVAIVLQRGGVHLRFPNVAFNRLNPAEGLRRIISRDAFATLIRGTLAMACLVAVSVPFAYRLVAETLQSPDASALAAVAWDGALCVAFSGAALAALFGGFDFAVAARKWRRRLRMTVEDLKRDQKESEGDPLLRSRRRSVQRRYSRSASHRVTEAAFVVTNPVHIAVALQYRPPDVAVPRVLIRACEGAALRLRGEAERNGVPVVEDAPLARSLYASTVAGEPIPLEFYVAVAAIVVALSRRAERPA
ncbi:MAG: EscU/YscU/HrcU family type III secretion system export apparatus switch protein [Candidatus Eremiobacteraeota bacterium]|nr:EscU/YscU/HrcU family type III secretion system export apparatus switch protein [Candidatus Eremiobacteraeota bacterium]